jgi:hypothetical protein
MFIMNCSAECVSSVECAYTRSVRVAHKAFETWILLQRSLTNKEQHNFSHKNKSADPVIYRIIFAVYSDSHNKSVNNYVYEIQSFFNV